jgi:hypothetical protein
MHKTKALAILIITLFALSAIPASATITGRHTLWRVTEYILNDDGSIMINPANFTYSDEGGYLIRTKINDYANGSLVAVNITDQTITGAQVWLWLSETGGAVIEANDTFYAGPFDLLDIVIDNATYYMPVTDPASGQTFWVGNNMIVGPIPTALVIPKGVEYYVKMSDVSPTTDPIPSSDVAVSVNKWRPYESLKINPTWGPAGIMITVTGMAWIPSNLVNVSWTTNQTWTNDTVVIPLISPNADGTFVESFYAPDLMIVDNTTMVRSVVGYYNGTTTVMDYANFTEYGRQWLQVNTIPSGDGTWGNDYYDGGVSVFDVIYVAGNYFNPRGDVTLIWDYGLSSEEILTTTAVNGTGWFNTTITIPESTIGNHSITAVDFSYNLNATLTVGPTLVLIPDSGSVGDVITALGYGFPGSATNANITLWWDYTCECYDCYSDPVNLTVTQTDEVGKFNVTFVVPASVGGTHYVWADNDYDSTWADDMFEVIPTLVVVPGTAVNNGTWIQIVGTGFMSYTQLWYGEDGGWYDLDIDYEKNFEIWGDCSGNINFDVMVTAGMEPGIHSVVVYLYNYDDMSIEIEAFTTFMVTTEEDPAIIMKLDEIIMKIESVNGTLLDILASVEGIDIDFTEVQDDIAAALATVLAELTGIETIASNAATAATAAETSAGTAAQSASDAKTAAEATQGTVTGINTAVYLAIILSLIAAIAAIIAVVTLQRKVA